MDKLTNMLDPQYLAMEEDSCVMPWPLSQTSRAWCPFLPTEQCWCDSVLWIKSFEVTVSLLHCPSSLHTTLDHGGVDQSRTTEGCVPVWSPSTSTFNSDKINFATLLIVWDYAAVVPYQGAINHNIKKKEGCTTMARACRTSRARP